MQGLGGIDPEEIYSPGQSTLQLNQINNPNSLGSALNLRRPRDFSKLIYQAGMTPSIGMTAFKTGVGVLGEYLKQKYGAGAKGKGMGGNAANRASWSGSGLSSQTTPGINYGAGRIR